MSESLNSRGPVDISLKSATKIILLTVGFYLLLKLSTIFLLFFLGSMLTVVLEPICKRIERTGLPRKYAVAIIAITLFASLLSIAALLLPAVANQVVVLVGAIPQIRRDLLSQIPDHMEFKPLIESMVNNPKIPDSSSILEKGVSALSAVAELFTAFSLVWISAVYLLADGKRAIQWFSDFFSAPTRLKLSATAQETSVVISAYATGQFITSIASATVSYFILVYFKVPGALTLATLAGVFDIVPIAGFFISLIPAALLAYTLSPTTALFIIILYSLYHMVENYVIAPFIYGSRMKISGLVVLFALLIGVTVGGVLLALAILPIVASYPIIERIWLTKFLGRDVIDRHARSAENRSLPDQVKMWDMSSSKLQRETTLSNRDLSKLFQRKVLIVEDDPDIRATLQDVLETEGYHTLIASNGNEALAALESVSGSIGLALMDVNMPGMDGKKLLGIMKTIPKFATIPVVFLSASQLEHDFEGAAEVLRKPSQLSDVVRTVERLYSHPKE